jgi:Transglycosylase SLT domain
VGFVTLLLLSAHGFAASPSSFDASACTEASATVEHATKLPPRLLDAIGVVETGRPDPVHHVVMAWPWSLDVNGAGYFYASKDEAVAAAARFRAAGANSIDVGCMQINLQDHPTAFASLDEAFDPYANTAYAARFLQALYQQTGNWPAAAAAYHSQTPGIGEPYRDRVMAAWPLAGRYGATIVASAAVGSASLDPYHVLTPSFRAQLERDAAFRAARNAAMVSPPTPAVHLHPRQVIAHVSGWRDAER